MSTPSKSKGPSPRPQPARPAPRRAWRLNSRALIRLGIALAVVAAIIAGVWAAQASRSRSSLLTQARTLAERPPEKREDGLALSYLKEYLAGRPDDVEALALRAEILARSVHAPEAMGAVIRAIEAARRANERAEAEKRDTLSAERTRELTRRLIEAYLAVGPTVPAQERKYGAAETLAKGLAEATGTPADIRLHAQTLEALATPANPTKPLEAAAEELKQARKLDPGDIPSAERLARLYRELGDPKQADAVLTELYAGKPTAPALLAAARGRSQAAAEAIAAGRSAEAAAFHARTRDGKPAEGSIEWLVARAVELAPKDTAVCLQAAELALAERKPAEAAAHLDRVPEADRTRLPYLTLRGVVALYENRSTDAVESWSRGLAETGGGEADLSWKLAFVLLQLGRIDQAEELIQQYRRLSGNISGGSSSDVNPMARYLEGLKYLKLNRPLECLAELRKARLRMPAPLRPQFHLTMGQAYEAVRDTEKAQGEYAEAIAGDPKFAAPRLAHARLLAASAKVDEAADELRRGLDASGNDPTLLMAMARLELDRQRALPKNRRSMKALEDLLARGKAAAPGAPALAILRANAMTLDGDIEKAAEVLARATAVERSDPELWIARAEKLVAMGRLDQAQMVLEQAMEPKAAGDQAPLRIFRARVRTMLGHGQEARDELVRDLDRVPPEQRPQLWMALGQLYAAQGDEKSAESALKAFAEWSRTLPDDPLPRLILLELALQDNSPEADKLVEESQEVLKRVGGVYALIGEAATLLRDAPQDKAINGDDPAAATKAAAAREARWAKAERRIEQIEKDEPKLRYGHLLRATLMRRRGDLAGAARAYEKALETEGGQNLLPRLIAVYNQMGPEGRAGLERLRVKYPEASRGIARVEAEAAARRGEKERAEALAREVIAGDPESLELRTWQARLLNTLGEPAKAEAALRELAEAHPESLGPWMALAYFQVGRGDREAAVRTVEAMIPRVKDLDRPELAFAQAWRVVGERDRADQAFEAALKRWPDDPRVARAASEYDISTGRAEKAEAIFRDRLARDESQRWAARGLALLLSSKPGDADSWRKAWGLVKDPAPGGDLPEDRLIRAVVLSRGPDAKDRDAAMVVLDKLRADLPADLPAASMARQMLAQGLLRKDPEKAAEVAAVDARGAGATPAALALHATALIAAGKLDDAERQVDRLDQLAPRDATTVALRARLLRARGKGDDAVAALERSAKEKLDAPDGEAAVRAIIQALVTELGREDAALRVAEMLAAKYPKSKGLAAAILARQGKREEALKIFLEVIGEGDPASVREAARNTLALITRDKFDPASIALAEKVIDAARIKDPKSTDLVSMAGYIRHYQGRYDDELKTYQDALSGSPGDSQVLNNMAWTLSEGLHRPEEALVRVNQAIKASIIVPPQLYDTRGVIYTRMGKFDDAIRDLELAVRDRGTATTWAHLARAYHKANRTADFEKARDQARKAGLTPEMIEPAERDELKELILGGEKK